MGKKKIDDCVKILHELRGAWEQIAAGPESAEAVGQVRAGLSYEA